MKKLLSLALLAAVLVPASAGAVVFSNISGTANMTVTTARFSDNQLITQAVSLVDGVDQGIAMRVSGQENILFIEDHITFTGTDNDASLIVQGNLLTGQRNRFSGPATFTLNMPAEIPATGTHIAITGASRVSVASGRNGSNRIAMRMVFQPASVVFHTFSSGTLVRTRNGDALIRVPTMVKTFTNLSAIALPPGFGNRTGFDNFTGF